MQVIRRKSIVDVYMKTGELFLDFEKEKEAKLFCDKALKLISGESKFVRSVKKVRKEIRETDEALDTNIEGLVSAGIEIAANVTMDIAKIEGASKKTKVLGIVAEKIKEAKNKNKVASLPEAHVEQEEGVD